jgi:serine/threonine protein kinase
MAKVLGKGEFGSVYELKINGFKTSAPLVVKKTLDVDASVLTEIKRQIILSNIFIPSHPRGFIPRVLGAMLCDKKKSIHIIMEALYGKTLHDFIKTENRSIEVLKSIIFQVLAALHYYGTAVGFTHYDLHTNNIMIVKDDRKFVKYNINGNVYKIPTFGNRAVLIDFGYSRLKYENSIYSNVYKSFGIGKAFNPEYDIQLFLGYMDDFLNNDEWYAFYRSLGKNFSTPYHIKKHRIQGNGKLTAEKLIDSAFKEYFVNKARPEPISILDGDKVVRL